MSEPKPLFSARLAGQGELTFGKGDCILQPPFVHSELDCSDDLEVLEIY